MITDIVSQVVNKYDLEGLLSIEGCPQDEYNTEIQSITAFVIHNYKRLNPILLADNIQYVFQHYFHNLIDYEICEEMATEIIINVKGGF